ncbi:apolipoprotein L3-like isoform X2 [Eleginops maclovinus]|uniref:apolipoprotein L3-like isoform X2 n=1 Tax=Eleginops maclovinus TaxID=56733 RepID=UPI00307FE482
MKVTEHPIHSKCYSQPPPLPLHRAPQLQQQTGNNAQDAEPLLDLQEELKPWKDLDRDLKLRGAREPMIIKAKAEHLYKAIQRYLLLFSVHKGTLEKHNAELLCIADNLDKFSKRTKIAGMTGGATVALGGLAAAAGVVLAPFTMGASLALTAAGVGVASAGGITGASAAITHKVNVEQGKKKINNTFEEFQQIMGKIQDTLSFIHEGMEHILEHSILTLSGVSQGKGKVTRMVKLTVSGGVRARALEVISKASGLMEGLALGMDLQLAEKKQKKKKKGLESGLAKKIRQLAEELNRELEELHILFKGYCADQ